MFNYWNVANGQQIPDLILDIGAPPAKRYAVHSSVIIQHSHYLRSLLADCRGDASEKNLYLPTVSSEQFSILLNYMYTGFLDITSDTVFSVLLAAHTLHMPKVLEICTSFMLQHQLRDEWPGSYLGTGTGTMPAIDSDRDIENQCVKIVKPIASKARKTDFNFISSPSACILLPSASETPFRAVNTTTNNLDDEKATKSPPHNPKDRNSPIKSPQCEDSCSRSENPPNSSRTIVDIASCDGPVRFRRVLNLAIFTDSPSQHHPDSEESQEIPSIFRKTSTTGKKSGKSHQSPKNSTGSQTNEIFSCLHCKHTFRSQYCYLKHAKRHLYPPDTPNNIPQSPPQQTPKSPIAPEETTQSTNVQYYPCKICGCKFPSYYFVHKHRKMCHRNTHEE
ncbi:telomere zinc finger-associated protein [Phlebotomus papatasi]|uniref:telomere zinc finger-associated protein n=1 Tax=Phlebotomus papatasi TaxID=29031 RepID=UPI0024846939|nr:telomere zinc finger-associated protein [Phlebotomus papatasi]